MNKIQNIYLKLFNENISSNEDEYNNICNNLNNKYQELCLQLKEIYQLMEDAKNKAYDIHGNVALIEYENNINKLNEFIDFANFMCRFFEIDQYDQQNEDIIKEDMLEQKQYYSAAELKSLFIKNIINFCKTHKLDPSELNNNFAICNDAMQEVNKICNPIKTPKIDPTIKSN